MTDDVLRAVLMLAAFLASGMLHEFMHAWVALKLGDPTGRDEGRLTLNPLAHLDPWNSVLLPIMTASMSNGRFIFGGMKPVQINPLNFRNPGFGMALSASAGPLTNYALAVFFFAVIAFFTKFAPDWLYILGEDRTPLYTLNCHFFMSMIVVNILLGTFNLLPIPPLDGSRILRHLLPPSGKELLDHVEPFGILFVILFCVFLFGFILFPIVFFFQLAMIALFGPQTADILMGALH